MRKRKTIKIKAKVHTYEAEASNMQANSCQQSSNGCTGSGHSGGKIK